MSRTGIEGVKQMINNLARDAVFVFSSEDSRMWLCISFCLGMFSAALCGC